MDDPSSQRVEADLTDFERRLLLHGVRSWNGPGYRPVMVARALGLASTDALGNLTSRLEAMLEAAESMAPQDWMAALFLTEVGFVSRVAGQGSQWPTTTGLDETATFEALRTLQRRLLQVMRQATVGHHWPGATTRSVPSAHIQYASASGDGMHVELCMGGAKGQLLGGDPYPVVLFRADREGEITWVVGGPGQAVELPLPELERAIEIAKKEVHCEEYYDAPDGGLVDDGRSATTTPHGPED